MGKKLLNNLSLKIISLIAAIIVWAVVVDINDPSISRRFFNVPVRFTNTEIVTGKNQVYEVLDGTDVVPVLTVTGQRSVVDALSATDITAVADFSNITPLGTVAISFGSNRYNSRIDAFKGSIEAVKIEVEDLRNVQVEVEPKIVGSPAAGHIIGDVGLDENLIRIAGPESIIHGIASAGIIVDASGATRDLSTNADIILYDTDGNEIDDDKLKPNITSVHVNIPILTVKEIPVIGEAVGSPEIGYVVTGNLTVDPATVTVAGKERDISSINAITLETPLLDLAGVSEPVDADVDIGQYLPNGIKFAEKNYSGRVHISLPVEREVGKEITLDKSRIQILGVPRGLNALPANPTEPIRLTVYGAESVVNGISGQALEASVDVAAYMQEHSTEGLEPGTHKIALDIVLPDYVQISGPAVLEIYVSPWE